MHVHIHDTYTYIHPESEVRETLGLEFINGKLPVFKVEGCV